MMSWTGIAYLFSCFLGLLLVYIFGIYLKGQRTQKVTIDRESKKEMEQLRKMRDISLTEPLSERVRPVQF